jgi:methyl-accepting chemotaxis protein
MNTFQNNSAENDLQNALFKITKRGDKIMFISLIGCFAFGLAIAFVYDTYFIALGVGSICLATYFIIKSLGSTLYQYVASGIFAIFTAQFIYQMHGLFEMHFFVFVGAALMIVYQDWRLQLPNIIIVVVHHATFAYLQYAGKKDIYFTQLNYMDLPTFMFHGGLAALIVGICGYWSYIFRKQTISNASNITSLNSQLKNINQNIEFADKISQGNLVFDYKLADENDELGKALLKMRENLLSAYEREQQERFVTLGIAQIGEIMRKYNQDLTQMADEVLSSLVRYVGANQAGIFLLDNQDASSPYLNLKACYAYERKKYISKKIMPGEGLVGQCFLEEATIFMTDIPQDYIKITSGLGLANPTSLALIPLKYKEETVGVLEIASFQRFGEKEITFLEKIAENIASMIVSLNVNERTRLLLEEAQIRGEEMRAQEEEMRQNMEEMEATQEEMRRTSIEMESKMNAINESGICSIEFDINGYILTANNSFLNLMGYKLSEIQGKHHSIFVEKEYAKSDAYKNFWKNLGAGKAQSGEFERIRKNGEKVYIAGNYSIIRNTDGDIERLLKLATDITQNKLQLAQLQAQEEIMKETLNELENIREELHRKSNTYEQDIKEKDYQISELQQKLNIYQ